MAASSADTPPAGTTPTADLRARKRQLSPRLLQIAGVSGVGIRDGVLAVYLAADAAAVRQAVARVLNSVAPDLPVTYVTTGRFRAH